MPRSFLTRLTCLWLAFAVLLGSSGFTVVEHVCQMRGKVSRVQLTPKACTKHCPPKQHSRSAEGLGFHKNPCCQVSVHYQHLETGQSSAKPTPSVHQPGAADLLDRAFLLFSALLPQTEADDLPVASNAPLNASGRDRLARLCTWLI